MVYNPLSQPPTRDVLQQEDDKIGPQWELWFNQLRALQRSMTGYRSRRPVTFKIGPQWEL
jgi:hypothetical protein